MVSDSVTPETVARQAFLSMGFSRQEYWNWSPFPTPGNLLDPGIEPMSLTSPALAGGFFTSSTTWEAQLGSLHCGIIVTATSWWVCVCVGDITVPILETNDRLKEAK